MYLKKEKKKKIQKKKIPKKKIIQKTKKIKLKIKEKITYSIQIKSWKGL